MRSAGAEARSLGPPAGMPKPAGRYAEVRRPLGELPPSVRVERYVPQDVLLPRVDLVVHHGGSGTMFGAMAVGVPQLVLPHGADQFRNADLIIHSGAGLALFPDDIRPDTVEASARRLLVDPSAATVAGRLAAEIAAMPSPAEAAAALLDVSNAGR